MKKLIFLLLIGVLLLRCEGDGSYSDAELNVITEDGSIPFEELLILINLKTSDSTYLVVKSIDSVSIYINEYFWTKINSQSIDTENVDKFRVGNTYQTDQKLNYLVIADQKIEQPDFTTAGDYADYLNSAFELKPGEYLCMIESFQVTFIDNTIKKYYPYEYTVFQVEGKYRSAYVGEIQINID